MWPGVLQNWLSVGMLHGASDVKALAIRGCTSVHPYALIIITDSATPPSKVLRYNSPAVKHLKRAKGTQLLFVGNTGSDMPESSATPPATLCRERRFRHVKEQHILHGASYYWSIFPAGLYMRGSVSNPNIRRGQKAPEVRYFYNRRCKPPENQQNGYACKPRSARSHSNGVSQGRRPALSRFAAARTAVACREFVGERWLPPAIAVVDISRVPRLSGAVRYIFRTSNFQEKTDL